MNVQHLEVNMACSTLSIRFAVGDYKKYLTLQYFWCNQYLLRKLLICILDEMPQKQMSYHISFLVKTKEHLILVLILEHVNKRKMHQL